MVALVEVVSTISVGLGPRPGRECGRRLDSVLVFTPSIDELKLALDGLAALGVPVQWFCGFTRTLAVTFSVARNWRKQLVRQSRALVIVLRVCCVSDCFQYGQVSPTTRHTNSICVSPPGIYSRHISGTKIEGSQTPGTATHCK